MNLQRLSSYLLFLLVATQVQSQEISVSGGGTYTSFRYQHVSSSWAEASTPIAFGFDFPSAVTPCYGCDVGTYRGASYAPASPTGLNPVLDDYFNSRLSAINPGLNTTLINSLAPANTIFAVANRSSVASYETNHAAYRWGTTAWTTVLSDREFKYQVMWWSYVDVSESHRTVSDFYYVPTEFDSADMVSWYNENPVAVDDWIQVQRIPIGNELSNGNSYHIEAAGYGNVVAAIPEPEIYAMMFVGLGMLGWIMRRRLVVGEQT